MDEETVDRPDTLGTEGESDDEIVTDLIDVDEVKGLTLFRGGDEDY